MSSIATQSNPTNVFGESIDAIDEAALHMDILFAKAAGVRPRCNIRPEVADALVDRLEREARMHEAMNDIHGGDSDSEDYCTTGN